MILEGYITADDGTGLFYKHMKNDKPSLMLMHGLSMGIDSWHHQIEHFKKDYSIITFEMRGHGRSGKPKGNKHYTIEKLAGDIETVRKELNLERFSLAGFSLGGSVALKYAQDSPERLERLVAINAPYNIGSVRKSFFLKHAIIKRAPLAKKIFSLVLDDRPIWDYRSRLETHMKCFRDNDSEIISSILEAVIQYSPENISLNVKHLLIYSSDDEIVRPIVPENANSIIIEGGHHYVIAQKPRKVNRLMEKFLK